MTNEPTQTSKRVLEPNERISEILFGLIMVLTFTGSLSVAEAGRDDVRTMLVGALGCNLAWGLIDGVFYLMGCLAEKGSDIATLRAVRQAGDPQTAHRLIADAVPKALANVLDAADLERLRQKLNRLPEPPDRPRLHRDEWLGALAVFFWVFVTTFPVAVPFLFLQSAAVAIRVSNAIAIAMLFLAGFAYAHSVGRSPWLMGLSMVGLGGVLVALTIALGG